MKGTIKRLLVDENEHTLSLSNDDDFKAVSSSENKRIDYWFSEKQRHDLDIILSRIMIVSEDEDVRNFLLCAFSNILKGCSRLMMKSVKPTIDKNKTTNDAYRSFFLYTQRMSKRIDSFGTFTRKTRRKSTVW